MPTICTSSQPDRPLQRNVAYTIRCYERQSRHNPASLTCSQCKRLLDTYGVQDLHDHMCSIPIRECLDTRCPDIGATMAQWLNRNEVQRLGELRLRELRLIQIQGRREAVDENQGRLVLPVWTGHAVVSFDATKVGNAHGTWEVVVLGRAASCCHGAEEYEIELKSLLEGYLKDKKRYKR